MSHSLCLSRTTAIHSIPSAFAPGNISPFEFSSVDWDSNGLTFFPSDNKQIFRDKSEFFMTRSELFVPKKRVLRDQEASCLRLEKKKNEIVEKKKLVFLDRKPVPRTRSELTIREKKSRRVFQLQTAFVYDPATNTISHAR